MVVDDEAICLESMKFMLQQAGVDFENQVDLCMHGLEAVNQVKEAYTSGMSYKLIFSDFSMPVMDGLEATREIRRYLTEEQCLSLKD